MGHPCVNWALDWAVALKDVVRSGHIFEVLALDWAVALKDVVWSGHIFEVLALDWAVALEELVRKGPNLRSVGPGLGCGFERCGLD